MSLKALKTSGDKICVDAEGNILLVNASEPGPGPTPTFGNAFVVNYDDKIGMFAYGTAGSGPSASLIENFYYDTPANLDALKDELLTSMFYTFITYPLGTKSVYGTAYTHDLLYGGDRLGQDECFMHFDTVTQLRTIYSVGYENKILNYFDAYNLVNESTLYYGNFEQATMWSCDDIADAFAFGYILENMQNYLLDNGEWRSEFTSESAIVSFFNAAGYDVLNNPSIIEGLLNDGIWFKSVSISLPAVESVAMTIATSEIGYAYYLGSHVGTFEFTIGVPGRLQHNDLYLNFDIARCDYSYFEIRTGTNPLSYFSIYVPVGTSSQWNAFFGSEIVIEYDFTQSMPW